MDSQPSRPRGRPVGSRDSYKRTRRPTKNPPSNLLHIIPHIQELIRVAKLAGYHSGLKDVGRRGVYDLRHDQEAVAIAEMLLLSSIRQAINNG